jgi:hypothetical protein
MKDDTLAVQRRLKTVCFESARASARRHLFSGLQLSGVNKAVSDFLDINAEVFCNKLTRAEALDWEETRAELARMRQEIRVNLQALARSNIGRSKRGIKFHVWMQQLGILTRIEARLYGG